MFGFIKKIFSKKEKDSTTQEQISPEIIEKIEKPELNQEFASVSEIIEEKKEEAFHKISDDISDDKISDNTQKIIEKTEEIVEEIVEEKIDILENYKTIDKISDDLKDISKEKQVEISQEIQPILETHEIIQEKSEILDQLDSVSNPNTEENKSSSFKHVSESEKQAIVEEIEKFSNESGHLKNDDLEIIKAIKENKIQEDLSYEEKSEKIKTIQHDIVEQVEELIENQLKKPEQDEKKSEELKIIQQDITDQVESLIENQLELIKKSEQERTVQHDEGKIILPFPLELPETVAVHLPQGYKVEFSVEEIEEQLNQYVFGNLEEDESLNTVSVEEESAKLLDNVSEKPKLEEVEKLGWFARLRQGLRRTRELLSKQLSALFSLNRKIDDDLYDELETILLTSDVGIEACNYLMTELQKRVNEQKLETGDQLKEVLKDVLYNLLLPLEQPLTFEMMEEHQPYVIMMVGVNGAGKTTTIGKLAKYFQSHGKSVLLGAGDTFRAAAREQLMVWGERNNVTVVAQDKGDPAAVIFDAIASAKAKKIDIVLADTAGRLATQTHLMAEIQKVKRVINKSDATAPHEIILVLDSNTGQNGLQQVKQFGDALGLTGLVLTKLDGTAKGGIIAAIAKNRPVPIRFIGVGEGIDDLRPFTAKDFVDAMFD